MHLGGKEHRHGSPLRGYLLFAGTLQRLTWLQQCSSTASSAFGFGAKKKKQRFGKEWLYMSRASWARTAGLTESELKNRALPKLRSHCAEFLEIRAMKATPDSPKTLWVSLDWEGIHKAIKPWDMYELELNKMGHVGQ